MALGQVRDVITYAQVREVKPSAWVDIGLSGRTSVGPRAKLLVKRIDGQDQVWVLGHGAIYSISAVGVMIIGGVHPPVPAI
jgi:hypothetical protein